MNTFTSSAFLRWVFEFNRFCTSGFLKSFYDIKEFIAQKTELDRVVERIGRTERELRSEAFIEQDTILISTL